MHGLAADRYLLLLASGAVAVALALHAAVVAVRDWRDLPTGSLKFFSEHSGYVRLKTSRIKCKFEAVRRGEQTKQITNKQTNTRIKELKSLGSRC